MHNRGWDSLEPRPKAHPRCPAPLDSGFRRNDGGYAQHPPSETFAQPPSFPLPTSVIPADAGIQGKAKSAASTAGATPMWVGREKRLFLRFWIPASAGMTRVAAGMTRVLIRGWDLDAAEG